MSHSEYPTRDTTAQQWAIARRYAQGNLLPDPSHIYADAREFLLLSAGDIAYDSPEHARVITAACENNDYMTMAEQIEYWGNADIEGSQMDGEIIAQNQYEAGLATLAFASALRALQIS